jgi:signal peptidase
MKKIISRTIIIALGLVLAGLAFLYFAPGYNLYLVRSESMVPTINMGDLIVTGPPAGPISGDVEQGKIITYGYSNDLVTHRVYSLNGDTLVTKGDAVEDPDPWTVAMTDVVGVYMFKIPYVGFALNFIHTKLGWFLLIIVPAALLVGWLAKDIVKEALSDA